MSDLVSVRSTEMNYGKSLSLALLLTTVGAIVIFVLSRAVLINQDFVGSVYENGIPRALAGLVFIGFPYLHQRLAGKRRSSFSHLPDRAVPLEEYSLRWYILLAYGVLITFAITGLSILLIWLVGIATGFFITRAVPILGLILLLTTLYYLGFWIGSRSARNPYLIAAGVVLGYTILELLVTVGANIDSPLRSSLGFVIFLILSLLTALIGARTGKQRHLLSYIRFLLKLTPEQDRRIVVENLYREVKQRMSDKQ